MKRCPQCHVRYERGKRCPLCHCDMPTPATIARRCRKLREAWSEAERTRHTPEAYRPVEADTAVVSRLSDHMRRRDAEARD